VSAPSTRQVTQAVSIRYIQPKEEARMFQGCHGSKSVSALLLMITVAALPATTTNAGYIVSDASSGAYGEAHFTYSSGADTYYYQPFIGALYGDMNSSPEYVNFYYNSPYYPYVYTYAHGNNSVDPVDNHIYVDSYSYSYSDPDSLYGVTAYAEVRSSSLAHFELFAPSTALFHAYAFSESVAAPEEGNSSALTYQYLYNSDTSEYKWYFSSYSNDASVAAPLDVTIPISLPAGHYEMYTYSQSSGYATNGNGYVQQYASGGLSLREITSVPEPTSFALLCVAAGGTAVRRLRRRRVPRSL
jgi:hypothetical protein